MTTWGLVSSGTDGHLGRGAHGVHVFGGMRAEKPGDDTGEWAGPDHGPLGAAMMSLQESTLYTGMGGRSYCRWRGGGEVVRFSFWKELSWRWLAGGESGARQSTQEAVV